MKKEKILFIISTVMMVIASMVTVYAANYLYNSNEVSYDNSVSHLESDNVQGAIDELYGHATDYTEIASRVSSLEGYFRNSPTSYFSGDNLVLGGSGNSGTLRIYDGGQIRGTVQVYSNDFMVSGRANSSAGHGSGSLNLKGSPVKINDLDVSTLDTSQSTTVKGLSVDVYKIGRLVTINIHGSPTSQLSTNETYETLITLPAGYRPASNLVNTIFFNYAHDGQFYVSTGGVVKIGYMRTVGSSTGYNWASGASMYATMTYIASS